ncbi:MAG: hypothetical protein FJ119_03390 [Deltaproteobacteria bacterium]|nr:hypothetical protein [Deltaproteobacteria bacterium]
MKRALVIGLTITLLAAGCGRQEKPAPPRMIPSCVLTGSWYEIGRQTAYYFPGSILSGALIFRLFLKVGAKEAQAYYAQIEPWVQEDIREQLRGMADGLEQYWHVPKGLARDLVLIWNLGIEINARDKNSAAGCTAFAFHSTSGTYLAHNTDNRPGTGGMGSAFYYRPDNGDRNFLSFFAPGFAGVGIGMNDSGLAITYNVGRPNKDAATGLPGIFMARQIMAKCATLGESLSMFKEHLDKGGRYGHGGLNFLLVDFKDSSMARVQLCSGDIRITRGSEIKPGVMFEGCSNHFDDDFAPLSETQMADPLNISSRQRMHRLLELAQSLETYDLQTCWNILTDSEDGLPSNTTICRRCDFSETTMTNIFTADTAFYSLGLPCEYLAHYGAPLQMPVNVPRISISGCIKARGTELARARVVAQGITDTTIRTETLSAPDGTYTLYNLPDGVYRITVKKFFHTGESAYITCASTEPQKLDFDLLL